MRKHRHHRFEQLEAYDNLRDQYHAKFVEYATADHMTAIVLETDILYLKLKMMKKFKNIIKKKR